MIGGRQRLNFKKAALALGAAFLFFVFAALGTWQVERRQWKLDLIERVESRAYGTPVDAPGPAQWGEITAQSHEYLRVHVAGQWDVAHTMRVRAASPYGQGFWLMTPLQTAEGYRVWINRGFVPENWTDPLPAENPAEAHVVGLLRLPEPHGGFLRPNRPDTGQWYSRDVAAFNQQLQLTKASPYFVDAQQAPSPEYRIDAVVRAHRAQDDTGEQRLSIDPAKLPLTGLTVLVFRNNHLQYAITWYALACMVAGVSIWLARRRPD
ncbi:SURF1 family protein [Limnobacter humi]|uniref:SURF1-like protein n=1 Tax=Limnobacter humi TaxID=1778671 RepID=A0ABT1WE84_9BURK|nr:SURF1 family cytochrome oxidase biogenesis protein [Limnobacter humi]MCQ8895805.1 SURF1 family protein [Limnobacter humi]